MSKWSNPVLIKELKLRFRSFKSISGLLFYLAALFVSVVGFLMLATEFTGKGFFRPDESFMMFAMLSGLQMVLVLFMTPGLTAGAISTEREKQTLNMLLTTTQSSFQIISGKLLASIAFLVLLMLAGLPLYSLVFLFGGVSPAQIVSVFMAYLITMLAVGSLGIMFSTLIRRTIVAMITTYGVMIFLSGFTAFFFFITTSFTQSMNTPVLEPLAYIWASINPAMVIVSLLAPEIEQELLDATNISISLPLVYFIVYGCISIIALWIATKRLRATK